MTSTFSPRDGVAPWFLVGSSELAAARRWTSEERSGVVRLGAEPFVAPVASALGGAQHSVSLGRDDLADVVLLDLTVSRDHAFFRETGPRLELIDVGSRNGTFVNGTRLAPGDAVRLYGGERLRFGSVELLLVDAFACRAIVRLAG